MVLVFGKFHPDIELKQGHRHWSDCFEGARAECNTVVYFYDPTDISNRAYKVMITAPIFFSCSATFLLIFGFITSPRIATLATAFILAGLPTYFGLQRWGNLGSTRREESSSNEYREIIPQDESAEQWEADDVELGTRPSISP
jgi:hypothetical protein